MSLDSWLIVLQAAAPGSHRWPGMLKGQSSIERIPELSRQEILGAGLAERDLEKLRAPDRQRLDAWHEWLEAAPDRELITFGSPAYPALLAELPDAPLALWAQGSRLDLLNSPQLAMVGSRSPTANGRETAERFAHYFSARGLTITSGLATGIDGASHRGALAGTAGTIAVLGSGPDEMFPKTHEALAAKIIDDGVIVSEYPPGTPVRRLHFPQRNRIIAGMSTGTLVVEAARRSGSLITARLAGEYGREVFAVPGSIHNPMTKGCHRLIRDGAKLVEDAADVLVELAPLLQIAVDMEERPQRSPAEHTCDLTRKPGYEELLAALGFDPCGINVLAERTGLTAGELSSMLLLLEMEGLVEALPGGRYSRASKRAP